MQSAFSAVTRYTLAYIILPYSYTVACQRIRSPTYLKCLRLLRVCARAHTHTHTHMHIQKKVMELNRARLVPSSSSSDSSSSDATSDSSDESFSSSEEELVCICGSSHVPTCLSTKSQTPCSVSLLCGLLNDPLSVHTLLPSCYSLPLPLTPSANVAFLPCLRHCTFIPCLTNTCLSHITCLTCASCLIQRMLFSFLDYNNVVEHSPGYMDRAMVPLIYITWVECSPWLW